MEIPWTFWSQGFENGKETLKVLILTTLAGIGHHRAAWAIGEGIKMIRPRDVVVRIEDPLGHIFPLFPVIFNNLFLFLLRISPSIWGAIYDNEGIVSRHSPIRWIVEMVYGKGILKILKEFSPDVIACTHVFATSGVGRLKQKGLIDLPLVSISTDYHYHPLGINDWVDIFVVPCEDIFNYLVDRGVPRERIRVCGISISPRFYENKDKKALRKGLGIGEDEIVVLVMGGGFGLGPIKKLIKSFALSLSSIHLLVVAGRNQRLRSAIQKIVERFNIKARSFGFVENIDELIGAADVVITKPGGLSISEVMTKGVPLIITEPIKGQEMWNVRYLLSKEVAVELRRGDDASFVVLSLLSNPWRLKEMRVASKGAVKPYGAIETAKVILDSVN